MSKEQTLIEMFKATGASGIVLDEFQRILAEFGEDRWETGYDEGYDTGYYQGRDDGFN